jgi:hypothetical protein
MCKYNYLKKGQVVHFRYSGNPCFKCKKPLPAGRVTVKYEGHAAVEGMYGEIFPIQDEMVCPKCGYGHRGWLAPCGDDLAVELFQIERPVDAVSTMAALKAKEEA